MHLAPAELKRRAQEAASVMVRLLADSRLLESPGDMPSPAIAIPGCPFHPRCHRVRARCQTEVPALREIAPGHCAACHFAEEM